MQMKSAATYSELIPCLGKRFAGKNIAAVSSGITFHVSFKQGIVVMCPSKQLRDGANLFNTVIPITHEISRLLRHVGDTEDTST